MISSVATPKTVVSIINWNSAGHTIACLEAVFGLDYPKKRVIVVDNASQDDSVDEIATAFPDVWIIRSPADVGFAAGHALALERARQDDDVQLFWMLNNDAFVEPQTLTELVNAYLRYGDCLYSSIPLNTQLGPKIEALQGRILSDDEPLDRQRDLSRFGGMPIENAFASGKPTYVTEIAGSSFMVPLSVVQQYGFMDDIFFLYGEEIDYCYRLAAMGVKSVLVPKSVVRHIHRASTMRANNPMLKHVVTYYHTRNNLIFFSRHKSKCYFFRYLIWVTVLPLFSGCSFMFFPSINLKTGNRTSASSIEGYAMPFWGTWARLLRRSSICEPIIHSLSVRVRQYACFIEADER